MFFCGYIGAPPTIGTPLANAGAASPIAATVRVAAIVEVKFFFANIEVLRLEPGRDRPVEAATRHVREWMQQGRAICSPRHHGCVTSGRAHANRSIVCRPY